MPRLAFTADEIERQRDAVCEAASRLFVRDGYAAVTMRAIAAEMRRSHTAVYRYFESKEQIFQRVRAAAFRRFGEFLARASRAERDPAARLRKLLRAYAEFALRDPDAYRLMFELDQAPKDGSPELAAAMDWAFSLAREAARAAVEAGVASGDVETLAHVLWAAMHGIVSLHLANHLIFDRRLDDLVEPLIDFLIDRKPLAAPRRARRRA